MRLFFTFVLLIAQHTLASDFNHLSGGMTFSEVQKYYPKSKLDLLSVPIPDRKHQYFQIKKSQHDGYVIFVFLNGYLIDHAAISEFEQKLLTAPSDEHAALKESIDRFKKSTSRPFKDQLLLASIIWKPNRSITPKQALKQYGPSDSESTNKLTHERFIRWNKGVDAYLTSDAKAISHFEFWFTQSLAESLRNPLSR